MSFKMRSAYFVAAISAALTVAAVASAKYAVDSPKIQIHAKGKAISLDGVSHTLKIKEDDSNLTFTTYLNTFDTKNAKRNEHMQERVGRKPGKDKDGKDIEIDLFEIKLAVPKDKVDAKKGGKVEGQLTFREATKKVPVTYVVTDKHVHATFDLDVSNYGVKWEKLCLDPEHPVKLTCVDPAVNVEVDFDLKD